MKTLPSICLLILILLFKRFLRNNVLRVAMVLRHVILRNLEIFLMVIYQISDIEKYQISYFSVKSWCCNGNCCLEYSLLQWST